MPTTRPSTFEGQVVLSPVPYCQNAVEYHPNGEDLVNQIECHFVILGRKPKTGPGDTVRFLIERRPAQIQKNGWLTTRACLVPFGDIVTRRIPEMKLNRNELEFLSAWAREEKAPDLSVLPGPSTSGCATKFRGVVLIRVIKRGQEPKAARTRTSLISAITPFHPGPGSPKRK